MGPFPRELLRLSINHRLSSLLWPTFHFVYHMIKTTRICLLIFALCQNGYKQKELSKICRVLIFWSIIHFPPLQNLHACCGSIHTHTHTLREPPPLPHRHTVVLACDSRVERPTVCWRSGHAPCINRWGEEIT